MANIIGKSDDLYEVWKGYNKLSEFSRPLANGVSAAHDGLTHVSVRPVGCSIQDWIDAGSKSIWTLAVKSVVIKC